MDAKQQPPPTPGYPLPPCAKDSDMQGGTWVMGTPMTPQVHPANQKTATWVPVDYRQASSTAAYNPSYANYSASTAVPSNPYVHVSPVPGSSDKRTRDTICKVLGRCSKKLEDSTRKAGDLAGNVWHHRTNTCKSVVES